MAGQKDVEPTIDALAPVRMATVRAILQETVRQEKSL